MRWHSRSRISLTPCLYGTDTVCHARSMKKAVLLTLVLGVGACSPTKSVAYYKGHNAALQKRLDDCVSFGEASQDCSNAKQAFSELHDRPGR